MDHDEIDLSQAGRRVTGHGRAAWLGEIRELVRLAVPLAAAQLAQMAILGTDVFMLGHLSKTALAQAALGNTIYFCGWLAACGPAVAVSPVIAHVLGAKPGARAEVRAAVRMGLWASLLLSIPLIAMLLFTRKILLFLGQTSELAGGAARFTTTLCLGLPFALGYQVLRNFATAVSRPLLPLAVMMLAILFNAVGDYALIFGHFGAPRLDLAGSGLASALSNGFSFFALLGAALVLPPLARYRILLRLHRPDWGKLAELFRLGLPIGMTMLFEISLFNGATILMGTFGTTAVAAHQIALLIPSITFMVPLGIGMAATVRVGLAAGAGDRRAARRAGFASMGLSVLFMGATSLLLLAFPAAFAGLWFDDPGANRDVIMLAILYLHVAAAFQIADGLQVTASLALRGLKDARTPMWLAGASYWLAGFPMCLLLGYGLGMKGLGIWLGLAFGLFMAAGLLVTRFALRSRVR